MFQFYEKVCYLDHESSFPSSKEKPGYFVGVAKNVGDKLTFKILTEDTRQLIYRIVVQSATEPDTINKRVSFDPALEEELKEPSDVQEGEEQPTAQLSGEPLPVQVSLSPRSLPGLNSCTTQPAGPPPTLWLSNQMPMTLQRTLLPHLCPLPCLE